MKFGKRELRPHPLAKRIKVSQQLLRQALIGPEGLVIDRLAYKFAVTQEKALAAERRRRSEPMAPRENCRRL